MVANSSAKSYKIEIQIPGGSSLDVTQACSGDSGGYLALNEPEPDQNGYLSITGKLTLMVTDGYFEGAIFTQWSDNGQTGKNVFDPDLNQTRWAVGNYVRIQIYNSSGVLVPFIRDYLRILKTPDPPYPGNYQLEIEIGDDLTLLNWRAPDDDASGVTMGALTDRTTIIGNILSRAGFGNGTNAEWSGTVGSYGLNNGTPKAGGSWIEQAGLLAFTGKALLWQNKEQEVLAKTIALNPSTPFQTVTLGQDEVDFKPTRGNEKPCSKVQVAGVGYELQEREDSGSSVSEEYASRASVQELDGDGNVVDAGVDEILVRQTFEDWYWDNDGKRFTRTITVNEARGLAVPDSFYLEVDVTKQGSPYTLKTTDRTTEVSIFGENNSPEDGFQIKKRVVRESVNGKELGDFYRTIAAADRLGGISDFLDLREAETTYINYRHEGSQILENESTAYGLSAKFAATAEDWADPLIPLPGETDTILSGTSLEQYSEINKDEWKKIERQRQAGTTTGKAAAMWALITTSDKSSISTAGQNQPPAAETVPPQFDRIERQYTGSVILEPLTGADYAPRERTYRLDYLTSSGHCETIAEILADWLQARYRGFQITVPFTDDWLDYEPMSRIDVVNGSTTYVGITSGVTFVLAADRAIVTANCMKTGTLNGSTIQRPYKLKLQIGAGGGGGAGIRILPYSVEIPDLLLGAGGGGGAGVTVSAAEFPTIYLGAGGGGGAAIDVEVLATPTNWWAFESSPWVDSIGSQTLANQGSGTVTAVAGFVGNAANFPGNGYLRRQDNSLSLNGASWRITFYLYLTTFTANKGLLYCYSNTGNDEFSLDTASSGGNKLRLEIYNSSFSAIVSLNSSVTLSTATWYAVEIELDLATTTAYLRIDGNEAQTTYAGTPTPSGSGTRFEVGNGFTGVAVAGTRIDELKIYR